LTIEPAHSYPSIVWQCPLDRPFRLYYALTGETPLNLVLMRLIDEQLLETPFHVLVKWPGKCGAGAE
jgi:putative transposase